MHSTKLKLWKWLLAMYYCVLVAVERRGPVRTALVDSDKTAELKPVIADFVDPGSHLMSDELQAYKGIGKAYGAHEWVKHGKKEFARGEVHNNTAESFNAILERAKQGVFHYFSPQHLQRYLHQIGFRWDHRIPEEKQTRKGAVKIVMKPMPLLERMRSLLSGALGRQIRRTRNGGIRSIRMTHVLA
jgi:hypothetical protein